MKNSSSTSDITPSVTVTPAGRLWLLQQVALAVALTVGFYGLALVVSLGLFLIAYATLTAWNSVDAAVISLCLASLCVACGLSILWSIGPRRYRFGPPGPRLDPAGDPDLFAVIQDVATATSQAMPADVYVINGVTAFVGQYGGVMGFRSRRVMGLGLPLMHAVSVQQLKAILAHELGHYSSGHAVLDRGSARLMRRSTEPSMGSRRAPWTRSSSATDCSSSASRRQYLGTTCA